jgi:PAS domain S-box-containing protein
MGDERKNVKELEHEIMQLRQRVEMLEQMEAERNMAEVEIRKLSRAVAQSASLIIITDPRGNIEYVNPKFTEVTGYALDEVQGKNARILKSGRTPDQEYTKMWRDLVAGKEWRGEFHNKKKNGGYFWAYASLSPIFDEDGKITHYLAVEEDISDRKRMEETLRNSETRYRGIFEGVEDAIFVESLKGDIVDVNTRACEMFGWEREQMLEMNVDDLVPEGHLAIVPDTMEEFSVPDKPIETVNVRANGEQFPVEITVRLQMIGIEPVMLVVVRDITDRKRVEKALEQSKLELERSNTELERFASIASHDLREPLRAIAGFARLLAKRYEGQLDLEADEYITYILDGTNRLQRLIDDLLTYSRVGTRGKEFETTDCNVILDAAISNLAMAVDESNASITYDPLPKVQGDGVQLEQLFQNLISNAIKFRGEDRPRVHVGVQREEEEWVFAVKDNGIGIEPQFANRIFEIFQRLHTQQEYPGTGIGLAICQRIVERHGGRIWFESDRGVGSTFYFTIPADEL